MAKGILCKYLWQESWVQYLYQEKKKRLNKNYKKRDKERRTSCDNQGISQTRAENNGKYVDTQHRST